MMVPGKVRLISGSASSLGLGPAVFDGFGTRLDVSRLQVTSARCRGTSMSHRGFRVVLGLGLAVSGRFAMSFLFRGLVSFAPFLMDLIWGPVSRFRSGLAPVSLHVRRRFLRTPLVLFQVVAVALVCPQFID